MHVNCKLRTIKGLTIIFYKSENNARLTSLSVLKLSKLNTLSRPLKRKHQCKMTGQHEITYLFTGFQMRSEMFVAHGNFRVLSPSVWLIKVVKFCNRKFRTSKSVCGRRGKKILENTENSAIARNSGIFDPASSQLHRAISSLSAGPGERSAGEAP